MARPQQRAHLFAGPRAAVRVEGEVVGEISSHVDFDVAHGAAQVPFLIGLRVHLFGDDLYHDSHFAELQQVASFDRPLAVAQPDAVQP